MIAVLLKKGTLEECPWRANMSAETRCSWESAEDATTADEITRVRERGRERGRMSELSGCSMCLGDASAGGLFGDGHQGDALEDQRRRNEVGISTLAYTSSVGNVYGQ